MAIDDRRRPNTLRRASTDPRHHDARANLNHAHDIHAHPRAIANPHPRVTPPASLAPNETVSTHHHHASTTIDASLIHRREYVRHATTHL
jgi:hypothetical protein